MKKTTQSMYLSIVFLLCLCIGVACTTSPREEATQISENTHMKLSQKVLDLYEAYNKGFDETLEGYFTEKVSKFLEFTDLSASETIAKWKTAKKDWQYSADVAQLQFMKDSSVKVPVNTYKDKDTVLVWARFTFDEEGKISAYEEETKRISKIEKSNYKQFEGAYVSKEHGMTRVLDITVDAKNELAYAFVITSPQCIGEFTGKAFFVDAIRAVSGDGKRCKLSINFNEDEIVVEESDNCRANQKNCPFEGVYKQDSSEEGEAS